MTREEIINMAREAGFNTSNGFSQLIVRHSNGSWVDVADELERFATLVAAAEREACAKVCEERAAYYDQGDDDGPESRRGRSAKSCADAIRARSNT